MTEELETRKCVLTGEIKPKNELLRFTVLKNGDLVPDFNKKLGGKGVYVSNSKSILEKAFKTVKIGKILHCNVKIKVGLVFIAVFVILDKELVVIGIAYILADKHITAGVMLVD